MREVFIMAQTNISIRVDEDVKKDVEALFAKLGLTLSAATNVFYRQAVRTQSIPFPVTAVETIKSTHVSNSELFEISKNLMVQNKEAYEVLAQ
jgi:DNA-damage-inducible protein J